MKLLEILQKELNEFPEGMLYAVQDYDGKVKFGKHSHPTLWRRSGVWNRYEDGNSLINPRSELAEDWYSAIVTKDMWENDRNKLINELINKLESLEKQRENEALAKITGVEMAGIVNQGHVHADLMAQYAEDAKTTDKPWELWEFKDYDGNWWECTHVVLWCEPTEYRRKLKTHIVNGVEVPDLRIVPKKGERYYLVDPTEPEFTFTYVVTSDNCDTLWAERGLCYENTEEGRQAAILHAKAWLGIV